jgi:hypothetical protein
MEREHSKKGAWMEGRAHINIKVNRIETGCELPVLTRKGIEIPFFGTITMRFMDL